MDGAQCTEPQQKATRSALQRCLMPGARLRSASGFAHVLTWLAQGGLECVQRQCATSGLQGLGCSAPRVGVWACGVRANACACGCRLEPARPVRYRTHSRPTLQHAPKPFFTSRHAWQGEAGLHCAHDRTEARPWRLRRCAAGVGRRVVTFVRHRQHMAHMQRIIAERDGLLCTCAHVNAVIH